VTETELQPKSQPLELTPPVWIGLALVALLGVAIHWRQLDGRTTIVRKQHTTHRFIQLGVEVSLPDGWTYLASFDDRVATYATMMHRQSHSIVSLRINRLENWPPQGFASRQETFANVRADWVALRLPRMIQLEHDSMAAKNLMQPRLVWTDFDPRCLGRIVPVNSADSPRADQTLIMIVVTHQRGEPVNAAVRELCNAIEFLGN
jgi:hypothetical protein